MVVFGIPVVELIIEALTAAAVGFKLVDLHATILPLLSAIDGMAEVKNILTALGTAANDLKLQLSGQQLVGAQMLYRTLGDAVTLGYVKPGEATDAVAYALEISGGSSANLDMLGQLTLEGRFKEYALLKGNIAPTTGGGTSGGGGTGTREPPPVEQSQGSPTGVASTPTIEVSGGPISAHLDPALAATTGGQLITSAESSLHAQSVAVPGLSPIVAKGITLALAAAYHDAITIDAMTLNHVLANVKSIDSSLATIKDEVSAVDAKASSVDASLRQTEATIAGQLTGLQSAIDHLGTEITGIDGQVSGIESQITGIEAGNVPVDLSGLQREIDGIDAQLPGLATTGQLDAVGSTADQALAEASTVAASIASIGALGLVATISDLEACCMSNSEITGPIRGGGATPSLLGQLGGLLSKAGAILLALGILDTINAIWDGQVVDLVTVQTATVVAPWVVNEILPSVVDSVVSQAQLANT